MLKEKLEIIELFIKISKDLFLLVFIVIFGFWVYKHYDVKAKDKFDIGNFFEAKPHHDISSKESGIFVANQSDDKKGDIDTAATGVQADAALAITTSTQGWVYLGTFMNGKFVDSVYFDLVQNKLPTVNSFATAKADMNKRASKPYLNEKNEWWKGKVIGLVTAGERVRFTEIAQDIPAKGGGSSIWAKITPLK